MGTTDASPRGRMRFAVATVVAVLFAPIAALVLAEPAIAATDPCDLVATTSVGRLLGSTGPARTTTVGSIPACRVEVGSLTLEVLDAGDLAGEYDAQRSAHADDDIQTVDDYVDGAFFGWGIGDAFDFVARRGDSVTIMRVTGTHDDTDFDAADPTASAPDGDVGGSEVGSALWVLMTEAFAAEPDTATPMADDLNGLWRTTDIAPCPPANDLGVRVSRFTDDGGDLRSVKVAGDSCLDNDGVDFEGSTQDGRGSGVSFASVSTANAGGTPYELQVDSPTQVTLSGSAGALQYTLVYQRLSWPGLALEEGSALLGIPTPSEALTAKNVVLTGALSGLLLLIVVFPTTLFNSALDANLDHYRRLLDRLRSRWSPSRPELGERTFWGSWRGVITYVVAAGVLFSLMQPGWGPNSITIVSLLGFVGGVAVSGTLSVVASRVYLLFSHRNAKGHASVEPATLAVASFFVLASRIVGFVPGYMYGVLVRWDSEQPQEEFDRGRIVAFSSSLTLLAALVAWALIPTLRDVAGPDPGILQAIPLSVVGGLFVGSVESLTIGLVPLQFLPGHTLRSHHRKTWAVLWAGGGLLFVLVLLRPGLVSGASRSIVGTIILVAVSSVVALSFWAYERRRASRGPGTADPDPPIPAESVAMPPPVPPQFLPAQPQPPPLPGASTT